MKNLDKVLITIMAVSTLFHSCKKEDDDAPSPNTQKPDYYIEYKIDEIDYRVESDDIILDNYADMRGLIQGEAITTASSDLIGNDTKVNLWFDPNDMNPDYEKALVGKKIHFSFTTFSTNYPRITMQIINFLTNPYEELIYASTSDSNSTFSVSSVEFIEQKIDNSSQITYHVYVITGSFDAMFFQAGTNNLDINITGEFHFPFVTEVK